MYKSTDTEFVLLLLVTVHLGVDMYVHVLQQKQYLHFY